ncbi:unnamed protein product, partial [Amoebophrya sp. A25]
KIVPLICSVLQFALWPITCDDEALLFFTVFTKSHSCHASYEFIDAIGDGSRAIRWNTYELIASAIGAFNSARNISYTLAD